MKTKYDTELNRQTLIDYFKTCIPKIFKLLPLYEDNSPTLSNYHNSFMNELAGADELTAYNSKYFFELLANLQSLLFIDNHKEYRSQVFKSLNICEKIIALLKEENENGI